MLAALGDNNIFSVFTAAPTVSSAVTPIVSSAGFSGYSATDFSSLSTSSTTPSNAFQKTEGITLRLPIDTNTLVILSDRIDICTTGSILFEFYQHVLQVSSGQERGKPYLVQVLVAVNIMRRILRRMKPIRSLNLCWMYFLMS